MSPDLLSLGRQVLAQQPFSLRMQAELEAFAPGAATLRMPIDAGTLQQHGFVHGGAISYLADNALTFAGASVLGNSVTVEFKINYVRPAQGPGTLVAEATVAANGKSLAACRCDVFVVGETDRTLVAVAQGTIRKVK
jgi:uncharacterized protein (TIGR00369 family)